MKNVLAFLSAALIATSGEWSKIWSDSLGPDGKVNLAKLLLSLAGVVVAAILVQMNRGLPVQKKDGGSVRLGPLCFLASFGAFVGFLSVAVLLHGCATTGPGRFVDVVVECGEDAVAKNPTVAANVRTCLLGLTAGGYVQCISLLPFTVDEITCVIAELSRGASKAVNTGDANPEEYTILRNANDWLKTNHVGIKRAP